MLRSEVKNLFFDRQKVINAMDSAERKIMNRISGAIKVHAQRSMKDAPKTARALMKGKRGRKSKRPAVSPAGSPPYARTKLLKRNIFYAYVPAEHASFIGPVKLNAKYDGIPGTLERGGTMTLKTPGGSTETVTYQPRPYMGPALDAQQEKFASAWANSIRSS